MKKTLKEKIAIMQAAERGEHIELNEEKYDMWITANNPESLHWDWYRCDYRVKPEPRVLYINEYGEGGVEAYYSRNNAFDMIRPGATREAVKYQEVVE